MQEEAPAQQLNLQHYFEHIVNFAIIVVCMDGLVPHMPLQHKAVQHDIYRLHGTIFMGATYGVPALWKQ